MWASRIPSPCSRERPRYHQSYPGIFIIDTFTGYENTISVAVGDDMTIQKFLQQSYFRNASLRKQYRIKHHETKRLSKIGESDLKQQQQQTIQMGRSYNSLKRVWNPMQIIQQHQSIQMGRSYNLL